MEGKSVMGIDTSTKSLAFCIYNQYGIPVKWGEIGFGGSTVNERLVTGAQVIRELKHEFEVDVICAEASVYVNNKAVVIAMAYALGMVISNIGNVNVEQYAPIKWQSEIGNPILTRAEKAEVVKQFPGKSKSWYSNKGREIRKQRTIDWVKDSYGIVLESDNVADAFGVGYMGWKEANAEQE